jgi:hypothetical protein
MERETETQAKNISTLTKTKDALIYKPKKQKKKTRCTMKKRNKTCIYYKKERTYSDVTSERRIEERDW